MSKTAAEWITFGNDENTPIAPVNTPTNLQDDPQFQARIDWIPKDVLGAEQLPSPIKPMNGELPVPTMAPTPGQHRDEILRDVLGYDDTRIAKLDAAGAFGAKRDS